MADEVTTTTARPIEPCAYYCVADGEFQEYSQCDGQIHVWVHTDAYKSILNCVYNPWVGDYIDPDRELDAEGIPLDIHCDYNADIISISNIVTYNTVNGYMPYAAFPYQNQARIEINGKPYAPNIDPAVLSVLRGPNTDKKCCCTTTFSMCPCNFHYAYILRSQLMTVDPDTGISGGDFLNIVTKTKFFGREWKPLFVIDNSVTERASIGNLGVEAVNDVEVFIKNRHETAAYTNYGGPIGNVAGQGKNHIPTKDPGSCTPYYPDLYDPRCNERYGGYNVGSTNSTWTFSGSKFLSTAVPTDFVNGEGQHCYVALLDKDIEYNYKFIDNNNVLTQDTTFKGKVAIQSMAIGGLNNVSVGVSYSYGPYSYKDNILGWFTEWGGILAGDHNPYIPSGYAEAYYECQYAGLSDFVARPFNLKSTGVFLTPLPSVTVKYMQTKLPYCYYDTVLQKNVAIPVDPDYPNYQYKYNQTASFKPQLGSITITDF